MDDYLAKPMRMSQIADMLHLHLVTKHEHAIECKPDTVKVSQNGEPTTSDIQASGTADEPYTTKGSEALDDHKNQIANQPLTEIQESDLVIEQILEQMVERYLCRSDANVDRALYCRV